MIRMKQNYGSNLIYEFILVDLFCSVVDIDMMMNFK